MIQLYQAEWCPFSHRVRAKLTELGVPYQTINVAAEGQERTEVEELTGMLKVRHRTKGYAERFERSEKMQLPIGHSRSV